MTDSETKSILVVEDDKTILGTLEEFLKLEGYSVLGAENGLVALELLKKFGQPHLILLDMKMPIMNGWQFAFEYLNKYNHSSAIVVMTAAADAKERANAINAIGWIGKPFDLDELLKVIKKYER